MRFRTLSTLFVLLVTFVLVLSSPVFAQTTVSTGSISGTVTDSTGAVVAGANVTITGPTGQTIRITTSGQGYYSLGTMVPGIYRVRIESKGFKTTQLTVDVKVDTTANGGAKLEIGHESTIVEVQATAVQVNTEQAEVQGVLSSDQISNLPVNGRNFLDLAQLEPGVQIQDGANFDPTKVGYSSISFGGRFGRTARINVDGVDISDETVGTTTEDIPASSIQEFSLGQSSLDLSNDLTSSGAVNVTTKSGTNALHGEAFGAIRDSSMDATLPSPASPTTGLPIASPNQRNQQGGDFGGPIIKDKLFFFMDAEHTLQHLAAPVAEEDPFTAYSGTFGAPFKEYEVMGRLDYNLTKTARMFGRYNYFQNNVYATFFPSSFQVYQNKDYTRNEVFGLDFNTGSFTHSVRFSYLKFQNQIADATRGSGLPYADYPVSMNIGSLTVGPNYLAPQSTPQSDHQIKYDASKVVGKHILRFGTSWNHIQGGGYASFFKIDPQVYGAPGAGNYCPTVSATCPAGPDGTTASNPVNYYNYETLLGNGQGFSTTEAALGFPAGGLGPDNRLAFYFGDTWKIRHNLTISPGLRWERDTGRTDSDLGAIPALNAAFPGWGNPVKQPNKNFAPQMGVAWDPTGKGKTSIRGGIGLYYENVIFNNVLFDRPVREATGAFLSYPVACYGFAPYPVLIPGSSIEVGNDPSTGVNYCAETFGQAGAALAAFQTQYQADEPFSLTAPNASYIGNVLAAGANEGANMFAPNYKSARALQINMGFEQEIRHGMVFSADYLRNVETHALLGIDINQTGAARNFNLNSAQLAIANTITACGATSLQGAIISCPGLNGGNAAIGASIGNFAAFGLGTPGDVGSSCMDAYDSNTGGALGYPCAFGGLNGNYGQMSFLEPISRSVFNALQMKLVENVANPMRGMKAVNFMASYQLSRFVNPMGAQGDYPPSNPVSISDQDFVIPASDNDHPLKYMGPSLLDRTHQLSFGGNFDVPWGFRFGLIAHFYSPLSSPTVIGTNGSTGQIFQTDFTGSGVTSDPMPGTTNGSYGRNFGLNGLNAAIAKYNSTWGNQATPAGQVLIDNGLFTLAQLQLIGAVAPQNIPLAASNQMTFPWLKAADFRFSWKHTFMERFSIEPNVGFYNVFNFVNSNLPPGVMTGWLTESTGSINTVSKGTPGSIPFRVGAGTGVFGLGSPRVIEWGLRLSF